MKALSPLPRDRYTFNKDYFAQICCSLPLPPLLSETGSHAAQAGRELLIICLHLLSARLLGKHHHIQGSVLYFLFFSFKQISYESL